MTTAMYVRDGTHHMADTVNLTKGRVDDDRYEKVLWAIVGQACEDATSKKAEAMKDGDCVWGPDEAMLWLTQTFGEEHKIVRRVLQLRAEGTKINVNLHTQDTLKRARRAK